MKILSKISIFLVGAVALASCNGPQQTIVNPSDINPANITFVTEGPVVLDRNQPDGSQITCKWTAASFGYQAAITYTVMARATVGDKTVSAEVAQTNKLEAALVTKTLNAALVKQLNATPGTEFVTELYVLSSIGASQYDTMSTIRPITITTFAVDPVPYWVIGEYCGWNHGNATKVYSPTANGIYSGWVRLYDKKPTDGKTPIKFTSAPDWDHDEYGGTLDALVLKGPNIMVENEFITLITLNIPTLKASIDKKAKRIGMVGNATPNDWGSPDTELVYDEATKTFRATGVALKAGEFKFRCDDDWKICDWGKTDTPGRLNTLGGGGNIIFDKTPGLYTVVFNIFTDYPSYELIAE